VLFSTHTQNDFGGGELFCFDHKGNLIWKFRAGRELKYGSKVYSADYRIAGLDVCDFDNDGNKEIIVISIQMQQWPCQLAVLNAKGQLLGEYWNSGYFADYAFIDLDGDGRKEIIFVGLNNERENGCLAVFDPTFIKGGSPQQSENFRCADLEPGTEKYYILFPRTDVDLLKYPAEGLASIDILENKRLSVRMYATVIYYEFDFNLKLMDVKSSHTFEQMHKEAVLKGEIKSVLNNEYWENLKRGVRWWDGEKWTDQPTMNLRWKDSHK
jgi:hypothetical protein